MKDEARATTFLPNLNARDALYTNATLIDVLTQTTYRGWFTVQGGRFIDVEAGDPSEADLSGIEVREKFDLKGAHVQPGMLDVHMHIESSKVTPRRFAEAAVTHGTTTILQDPHEVANVAGAAGIRWMIEASRDLPIRVYSAISSCVPATSAKLETPNASLEAHEVPALALEPGVIALGEVMDFMGLIQGDERMREIVAAGAAAGLSVEGHVPSLSGAQLSRYIAHGIRSDHTLATPEKLLEELRKGLWVMLQEKSLSDDVVEAVVGLKDRSRLMLITDDVMPDRLHTGHMSRLVELAVEAGWPVLDALAAATVRPATYLGLHHLGVLAPGAHADFLVTDGLAVYPPREVYVAGELQARAGESVSVPAPTPEPALSGIPASAWSSGGVSAELFQFGLPATADGSARARCRVITTNKVNSLTHLEEREVEFQAGVPVDEETALACVIPRAALRPGAAPYQPVVCLVAGTGLKEGGYAATFAHDSHNVFVFGRSPAQMAAALKSVLEVGGGMAFDDGERTALLPLPLLGLLSDEPVKVVGEQLKRLESALREAGMDVKTPVLLLTLLPLSVSPNYKVTDKGVIDVQARKILTPVVTP